MSVSPTFSVDVLRDIEAELSEPTFRGVPIGPVLSSACFIKLRDKHGDWSWLARWKNRARQIKYFLRSGGNATAFQIIPKDRILVTWFYDNFRVNELIRPVIEAIGPERCVVLGGSQDVLPLVPQGAVATDWDQVVHFDVSAWRADYLKCRPEWHRRLRNLCRKHNMPRAVCDSFAFHIMVASRSVAGCLEFLQFARPAVVLTEYDRNDHWSPLVLSACLLGIPTLTMVHGVMGERAVGFTPVLADKILCWGEMQRRQLIEGGERRAEIIVVGCPRLTRELSVTSAEAKTKLGLPADKPAILLGTTPVSKHDCLAIAETFCAAVANIAQVSSIVRLHPSERLETYESVIHRYPNVRFFQNADSMLDESLAAADIVVVPNSGLGSDALVKRRLVIALDLPNMPLGHGRDLIDRAGCPRASSSESLREIVPKLLADSPNRHACETARETFVADFIAYFGKEAAKQTAKAVISSARTETSRQCDS